MAENSKPGRTLSARPILTGNGEPGAKRRPPHVGPLASLPLFHSLSGRRVIVAGGSADAAWKAELLASAGAAVVILAGGDVSAEMRDLLRGGPLSGSLCHVARQWVPEDLVGAAIAIADCETDDEASEFVNAARAAGVPVNVIDKPAFCDFRFGSIVNRSPVVIGISTDGAAPILGQAIRRRIETLLPPALADWAALAARVRDHVMDRLAPGPLRRAFWEHFSDHSFTHRSPTQTSEAEMERLVGDLARSPISGGRVTLVGAGPGEAELLTLKAVRALQAADVILFDDLVSDEVLELARREAKRMLVGKRADRESCRQEDINDMMIALARSGRHVVRLKSGDVSIFGRAGEELAALTRENIPVTIVPGVTAASAMASAFGVSLTHRERAQQVRFVTGHSRKGGLPEEVDWNALADERASTIFYMGGRTGGLIAARLMEAGLPATVPVAVAANLSHEDQKLAAGRLGDLEAIIARIGLKAPLLIGVGHVFEEASAQAEEKAAIAIEKHACFQRA
ncbi:siroheme synthase CysG [Consotaella salsifontis]|uniref:Uroporphyrin-III C-methyltransferase / precorrin-2 dehydrogenase / sirohydrochlorin ferrochelatase n=1 Tax=Consotaella salsifontis TaxID=1365950 RepID=A0A1T4R932_9HYPH|nr:siroheme synthase CysG [Consotaella salsifontis]SKA12178.1 uroporphyrin-III C-methyltransferase / precorrin-2 dehydrogenase / sirohydrochlorin ferrochelatase [Consotaella salsifontis]